MKGAFLGSGFIVKQPMSLRGFDCTMVLPILTMNVTAQQFASKNQVQTFL